MARIIKGLMVALAVLSLSMIDARGQAPAQPTVTGGLFDIQDGTITITPRTFNPPMKTNAIFGSFVARLTKDTKYEKIVKKDGKSVTMPATQKDVTGEVIVTIVLKAGEQYYPAKGNPTADKVTVLPAK